MNSVTEIFFGIDCVYVKKKEVVMKCILIFLALINLFFMNSPQCFAFNLSEWQTLSYDWDDASVGSDGWSTAWYYDSKVYLGPFVQKQSRTSYYSHDTLNGNLHIDTNNKEDKSYWSGNYYGGWPSINYSLSQKRFRFTSAGLDYGKYNVKSIKLSLSADNLSNVSDVSFVVNDSSKYLQNQSHTYEKEYLGLSDGMHNYKLTFHDPFIINDGSRMDIFANFSNIQQDVAIDNVSFSIKQLPDASKIKLFTATVKDGAITRGEFDKTLPTVIYAHGGVFGEKFLVSDINNVFYYANDIEEEFSKGNVNSNIIYCEYADGFYKTNPTAGFFEAALDFTFDVSSLDPVALAKLKKLKSLNPKEFVKFAAEAYAQDLASQVAGLRTPSELDYFSIKGVIPFVESVENINSASKIFQEKLSMYSKLDTIGYALADEIKKVLGNNYNNNIQMVGYEVGATVLARALESLNANNFLNESDVAFEIVNLRSTKHIKEILNGVNISALTQFDSVTNELSYSDRISIENNNWNVVKYSSGNILSNDEIGEILDSAARAVVSNYMDASKEYSLVYGSSSVTYLEYDNIEIESIGVFENSPSAISVTEYIPDNAQYYTFDMLYSGIFDGDWITFEVDDVCLWSFIPNDSLKDIMFNVTVPVGMFAGDFAELRYVLNSVGQSGFKFYLSNFKYLGADAAVVPEPSSMFLIVVGVLCLFVFRVKKSHINIL